MTEHAGFWKLQFSYANSLNTKAVFFQFSNIAFTNNNMISLCVWKSRAWQEIESEFIYLFIISITRVTGHSEVVKQI